MTQVHARKQDRPGTELVEGRPRSAETLPQSADILPPLQSPPPKHPAASSLTAFYEAATFDTLRALWRKRAVIVACVGAGLVLAALAIMFKDRSYTAEAVIQLDFARQDSPRAAAPGAAIDAGILVEGEARLIRSMAVARKVVTRLKLDENPTYTQTGLLSYLLTQLNLQVAGTTKASRIDLAGRRLTKQLQITNDTRSYLINIAVVSNSPEWSAQLANAFATEYLRYRIMQRLQQEESTARAALQDARSIYGDKHPTVLQAKALLDAAEARTRQEETRPVGEVMPPPGHSYLAAEANWLPTAPNPVALLGLGLIGSLVAGIGLALLLEWRDTSLRTERSVAAETGIRCVGMIPKSADRASRDRLPEQLEAFRSLCVTVGLAGQKDDPHIVLISSALPTGSKAAFVKFLAGFLNEDGKRVLIIDLAESRPAGEGIGLDDVIHNPALMHDFLNEQSNQSISELRRNPPLGATKNPLTSISKADRAFEQFLTEAKAHYDVLILNTPPTLLFADSISFGRFADISLHVVVWNRTPRETVIEAIRRLNEHRVRVDGIVLIEIDLDRYPSFEAGDRTYYVSKYDKLFSANS